MSSEVLIHPNFGECSILIDGHPYHWDGALCTYRPGWGPYATTTSLGKWREPSPAEAERIAREALAAKRAARGCD